MNAGGVKIAGTPVPAEQAAGAILKLVINGQRETRGAHHTTN
jgi:hypothetical protein